MAPTSVLRRINDQLVAPRASRGELLVAYTAAFAGSALATLLAADAGLSTLRWWSWPWSPSTSSAGRS